MKGRIFGIRWSFLGLWLIAVFILAKYVEFSICRFAVSLIGSLCWYKIAAFLDRIEDEI
jgi:hypothetical protein